MKRKLTVKFVHKKLLLLILLFSCAGPKEDPYLLSDIPEIRELERYDHKLCTDLKLNFDGKDNFLSRDYWHCRLSFAKYRLSAGGAQSQRDQEINDLVAKISLKISATPESVIVRENIKMDSSDHKKCLSMGFVLDTDDLTKAEDYFACRKVLLDEAQVIPPFGNMEYLQYQNHSYGIGFVVDQRITKAIARYNELRKQYPNCVSYNVNGANFKRCVEAEEKSKQCLTEIDQKKYRREGDEKVECQKRAYIEFGDFLMKKNEQKKQDIARASRNSDYYNQQNFAAIGLDETRFAPKEDETTDKKKSAKEINSKTGIYEKYELTKLRQKYVTSCQNEASRRMEEYANQLKKACEEITKFEVLGEEDE